MRQIRITIMVILAFFTSYNCIASAHWNRPHELFWTETWANFLSKEYFGAKWLGKLFSGYPAKDINIINKIRLAMVDFLF